MNSGRFASGPTVTVVCWCVTHSIVCCTLTPVRCAAPASTYSHVSITAGCHGASSAFRNAVRRTSA